MRAYANDHEYGPVDGYAAYADDETYDPEYEPVPEPPPARGGRGLGFGLPVFLGLLGVMALLAVVHEKRGAEDDRVPMSAVVGEDDPASFDLNQGVRRPAAPRMAPVGARADADPVRVNNVYNQSRKLMPFAALLGPVRPGEWRAIAQEPTQTYYAFARDPQRPSFANGQRTIVIQPFSDLSTSGQRLLPLVRDFLAAYFDMNVRVAAPLSVRTLPETAWRRDRAGNAQQMNAEYTLSNVLAPRLPPDGAMVLGITGVDLHPGGRWTYESAFGWSSFYGRTALVSLARAFPGNDRREATMADFVHLLKFATHETAHAFGLKHCDRYVCLVNGRTSLAENANKPLWLCPDCYAKLALAAGFDGVRRAERLATFCERQGMTAERDYWRNVAQQMRTR